MFARHNINVYADELQRTIGEIKILLKTADMDDGEQLYWYGVKSALEAIYDPLAPETSTAFIARMKMHIESED